MTIIVGCFFIVLAVIFSFAAASDFRKAGRQWGPAAKAHRKIAIIFAIVGAGLIAWRLLGH